MRYRLAVGWMMAALLSLSLAAFTAYYWSIMHLHFAMKLYELAPA